MTLPFTLRLIGLGMLAVLTTTLLTSGIVARGASK